MFDLVIKDGVVVDGSGNPWFKADVAVDGARIASIGRLESSARTVLRAEGLVVAPGFIDTHSHSDLMIMAEPLAKQKVMQGVTTEILGQDGFGEAPLRDGVVEDWRKYLAGLNGDPDIEWDWRSFDEYLRKLETAKPSVNLASLVGHGNVRLLAMGMENKPPTPPQLEEMKDLVDEAMRQGAFGLSTGLIYAPCIYSQTEELIELCKVASRHGGVFVVHMRDEGDRLLESIGEVVKVGREAKIPVHISHFKASGKQNWGKVKQALRAVDEARSEGIDVTADQYPYTAGSTFLSSLLPSWAHVGGTENMLKQLRTEDVRVRILEEMVSSRRGSEWGWDSVYITSVKTRQNKRFEGKSVEAIAKERNQNPVELLIDLTVEEDNAATMVGFSMSERDVRTVMKSPLAMVCTDGIVLGKPHPRAYGSFPRVLGRYVRRGVLRLEDTVRKMTSLPALRFGLWDRGLIRPGMSADLTIFDPKKIIDTATYRNPIRFPVGIEYVIVNGEITVEKGEHKGARAGKVLRHRSPENALNPTLA